MASFRPATDSLGCFVERFDARTASTEDLDTCRDKLFEHGVLFLRGQDWDCDAHLRFARHFGSIDINRFFTPVPGFPEIAQVITEPDQPWVIGENWHTDHSYDEVPAMGSILYAVETPPSGGDTCFAGMHAAYDALDAATRERIEGLTARHESAHIFAASEAERSAAAEERQDGDYLARARHYPEAVHPVVLRHPVTGRKGLYVNPEFTTAILGLDKAESDALLAQLFEHILNPRFLYRFEWEPGSVAIWDNRSTWHRAMNDYRGHRRHMHRITIGGVALDRAGTVG